MAALSSPRAYQQASVLTASPERLVVMLYDGALRFLRQAAAAMANGQIEVGHRKLRRAEDILQHLRSTLDMEQGQIAERLQAIYRFCEHHLLQARFDRDPEKVNQVITLLAPLRDAWAAIEGRT